MTLSGSSACVEPDRIQLPHGGNDDRLAHDTRLRCSFSLLTGVFFTFHTRSESRSVIKAGEACVESPRLPAALPWRQRPERIFLFLFPETNLLVEYDLFVGVWNEPSIQSVRHPELLCLINSLAFALCRKSILWGAPQPPGSVSALHGSPLMTAPRLALPKRHVLSFQIRYKKLWIKAVPHLLDHFGPL